MVFTEGVIHGAFGGGVGRHQICASFVENPKTERHLNQIMAFYGNSTWSLRPTRSYVESDRPRIRRMVQKPLEWGFDMLDYWNPSCGYNVHIVYIAYIGWMVYNG